MTWRLSGTRSSLCDPTPPRGAVPPAARGSLQLQRNQQLIELSRGPPVPRPGQGPLQAQRPAGGQARPAQAARSAVWGRGSWSPPAPPAPAALPCPAEWGRDSAVPGGCRQRLQGGQRLPLRQVLPRQWRGPLYHLWGHGCHEHQELRDRGRGRGVVSTGRPELGVGSSGWALPEVPPGHLQWGRPGRSSKAWAWTWGSPRAAPVLARAPEECAVPPPLPGTPT